jgi:uncharacterized protein YdaT
MNKAVANEGLPTVQQTLCSTLTEALDFASSVGVINSTAHQIQDMEHTMDDHDDDVASRESESENNQSNSLTRNDDLTSVKSTGESLQDD